MRKKVGKKFHLLTSVRYRHAKMCAPVCGTDDEDVLFVRHAVHLCEYLVDDSVSCTTCITCTASSRFGDGVQLIKKQDAGGCLSGLEAEGKGQEVKKG